MKCFCLSLIFLDQSISDKDFFRWFALFGSSNQINLFNHQIITGNIYRERERVNGKVAHARETNITLGSFILQYWSNRSGRNFTTVGDIPDYHKIIIK